MNPMETRHWLPKFMQLFSLFWPWTIFRTIVGKTNCYGVKMMEKVEQIKD